MFIRSFLPAILWSVLILVVCAFPGDDIPESFISGIPHTDKIIHFILYLLLVIFIMTGFIKTKGISNLSFQYYLFTFLIALFYGIIIEFLQYFLFIQRGADLFDVTANAAGSLIGLLAFTTFLLIKRS